MFGDVLGYRRPVSPPLSQRTAINISKLGSLSFASSMQCHGHENCVFNQITVELAPLAMLMGLIGNAAISNVLPIGYL